MSERTGQRERVRLTAWRFTGTGLERVDSSSSELYDVDLSELGTVNIGRIVHQILEHGFKFSMPNVEIELQNLHSDTLPSILEGLGWGVLDGIISDNIWLEITIDLWYGPGRDWLAIGNSDDRMGTGHWQRVFAGWIEPRSLRVDEDKRTVKFNAGSYDKILYKVALGKGWLHARNAYAYINEWKSQLLTLVPLPPHDVRERDATFPALPTTRCLSCGGDAGYDYPSAYPVAAFLKLDDTNFYLVDSANNGYKGSPISGWVSATHHNGDLFNAGRDGLFDPQRYGYGNLDETAMDINSDGFPYRDRETDGDAISGQAFDFSHKKRAILSGNEISYADWGGLSAGYGASYSGGTLPDRADPATGDWALLFAGVWGFAGAANKDDVFLFPRNATFNPSDCQTRILGEIKQWNVWTNENDVYFLTYRHSDKRWFKVCGGSLSSGNPWFVMTEIHPSEAAKKMEKFICKKFRWANEWYWEGIWENTEEDDADPKYYWMLFDEDWQLVERIKIGKLYQTGAGNYAPPAIFSNLKKIDTSDNVWLCEETAFLNYGRHKYETVYVERQGGRSWAEHLDDLAAQTASGWWVTPDRRLLFKPLFSGDNVTMVRAGDMQRQGFVWKIWADHYDKIVVHYGEPQRQLTIGDPGDALTVDRDIVSQREIARWLGIYLWLFYNKFRRAATLSWELFYTALFNRFTLGVQWGIQRLTMSNTRTNIGTDLDVVEISESPDEIMEQYDCLMGMLAYNSQIWDYGSDDGDINTAIVHCGICFGCKDVARALLDRWCEILNGTTITATDLVTQCLYEHMDEWSAEAKNLINCLEEKCG